MNVILSILEDNNIRDTFIGEKSLWRRLTTPTGTGRIHQTAARHPDSCHAVQREPRFRRRSDRGCTGPVSFPPATPSRSCPGPVRRTSSERGRS